VACAEERQEETVAAHRAYLLALLAWERTSHEAGCPTCASKAMSAKDYDRAIATAEAHKEACRVRFRDLVEQLGYVPTGHGVTLPGERFAPNCDTPAN
jgi:hypothetical protein